MDDDDNRNPRALPIYAVALALVLGGGALGYAWGLAQLLIER
ncbi:MAG: hypothetical protein VYD90_12740 [Pseudomonadota bacterium]|nr:hypothetical protein [Pseudomonadota bacterium]